MGTKHRTVVVTGGSSGIGAAVCRHLIDSGIEVINLSLERPASSVDGMHTIEIDLANRDLLKDIAAALPARFDITGLVHCAGVIRPDLLENVELDDLDYLNQVHIGSAITLAQAFIPAMKRNAFGRIVLISSRAALGLQTRSSYSATKAGLIALARTWALELGGFGITVNTVAPGPITGTRMFHDVVPEGSEKIDQMATSIPVQRLGTPDDVARAVLFFNDPANSFVTGQTLMVCGGASLGSLSI